MKCLLGIDPEKTQKCKPSECASCGWEAAEAARRREYVKEHGLTLCADGFRRLIIRKEKDMATPYKECPHCGAHLDSGEKCECCAEEIEAKNSQKYAALEAATSGLQGIEAFCTANAIKYLWRWKLKNGERAQTAPQERSYSI